MTPGDTTKVRAEYDAVLAKVASRRSTEHFAHAAVTIFAGLIVAGATGKLWWDFRERYVEAIVGVGCVSLLLLVYACARLVLGRRALQVELIDFARLQSLRSALRLDDPTALFP